MAKSSSQTATRRSQPIQCVCPTPLAEGGPEHHIDGKSNLILNSEVAGCQGCP
jgi:hypothetical protein